MRWFIAILLVLFGALLFSLTIDDMGNMGHIIMKIIGVGCIFIIPGFIIKWKKEKN